MLQKSILYLFFCCITTQIQAQTAAIAHKSHSGTAATMPALREGGFGNPPDQLVRVVKISTTTIVEIKQSFSSYNLNYGDTIKNHPYFCNPKISLDSLKRLFPHLQFEGFEQFEKAKTPAKSEIKTRKKARFWGALNYPLPSGSMTLGILGILSICAAGAFVQYKSLDNVA